jgi:hypothetical protein
VVSTKELVTAIMDRETNRVEPGKECNFIFFRIQHVFLSGPNDREESEIVKRSLTFVSFNWNESYSSDGCLNHSLLFFCRSGMGVFVLLLADAIP